MQVSEVAIKTCVAMGTVRVVVELVVALMGILLS